MVMGTKSKGMVSISASNGAIEYLDGRLSGRRKIPLQQELGYGNIVLSSEILTDMSPTQREIVEIQEPLVREILYIYSTYVQ